MIEKLDWDAIIKQFQGKEIGKAMKELSEILVDKMNEIVDDYNQQKGEQ